MGEYLKNDHTKWASFLYSPNCENEGIFENKTNLSDLYTKVLPSAQRKERMIRPLQS